MSKPFKFFDHEIAGSSAPNPDRLRELTPFFAEAPPQKTETLIHESAVPEEDLTEGMDLPVKTKRSEAEDEMLADLIRNHPNNQKKTK